MSRSGRGGGGRRLSARNAGSSSAAECRPGGDEIKQPGIGGEVRWHQDATFFDSTTISVTTFWFALEDATVDNGCLWTEPGGHRGPLRERFLRDGDTVTMPVRGFD